MLNLLKLSLAFALGFALGVGGCKQAKKADDAGHTPRASDAAASTLTVNGTAIRRLHVGLTERYSHRDRLGIDWHALISENRAALEASSSSAAFAMGAATMLAAAKDTHLTIIVDGGKPIPTHRIDLSANVDLSLVAKRVNGLREINPCLSVGRLGKTTGYLLLKSFARDRCPRYASAFEAAWADVGSMSRLIVDARANTGGDETLGRIVASRFVPGDIDYALTELGPPRQPSKRFPRRLRGAAKNQQFGGEVRVLIGGMNLSSAEAFILMMKQAPRAKLIGAKTYGSSGNPKGIMLGNGVTVMLPSWRAFTLEGEPLEGNGIEPDIAIEWPKASKVDVVLDAALASF